MRRVEKRDNGCWEFNGCRNEKGYGIIGLGGRGDGVDRVHRVTYRELVGPIPEGMFVCHKCDNPACCNPEHLFLGTVYDNNNDMRAKGRGTKPPRNPHVFGTICHSAKLNETSVSEMRARYSIGESVADLARKYGVTFGAAQRAILRQSWRHVWP